MKAKTQQAETWLGKEVKVQKQNTLSPILPEQHRAHFVANENGCVLLLSKATQKRRSEQNQPDWTASVQHH